MDVATIDIWKPRPLPEDQWRVQFYKDCIGVSTHINGPEPGCLYWTRLELSDFPKDLFSIDDLKRAVVAAANARIAAGDN